MNLELKIMPVELKMSLELKQIQKLAEEKADFQERRGTSAWFGLYYGFIFGYQACEAAKKQPMNEALTAKTIDLLKRLWEWNTKNPIGQGIPDGLRDEIFVVVDLMMDGRSTDKQ